MLNTNCLTCTRKLLPQTHVPHELGEPGSIVSENYTALREERKVERAKELSENRLGYLGESQFCSQTCAAFFGRTAVHLMSNVMFFPDSTVERLGMGTKLAIRLYPWVSKRVPK